jgi:predicted ATP-grasp superfamily ATP-dependent carboligase
MAESIPSSFSSSDKRPKVLITDVERRKAIPIIRALSRAGSRVIGTSAVRFPLGQWSKYCRSISRTPSCKEDEEGFLEALCRVCQRENPDVLLPLEEPSMSACIRSPSAWEPYASALLPNRYAFEQTRDKWKTLQQAKQCGIDVPTTYCPDSQSDIRRLARDLDGEWVVKPRKSSGSRGIRYVEDPQALPKYYEEVASSFPRPMVQRRISNDGPGLGVFACLDANHNPVAVFGHRRLREYPLSGGPSTLRESWKDETLICRSLALLQELSWTGVAMIEYKQDPHTGKKYLMEINPRFWGSIELAIAAGVDFPVYYRDLALEQSVSPVRDFPIGVRCRWLLPGDILHFLQNPNRWSLEPGFFQFWGSNLHYDLISMDDPGPMLGIFLEGVRKLRTGR